MPGHDPFATARGARPNTLLIDPENPEHVALRLHLSGWRAVPVDEVVGLDVLDAARSCVADHRLFDRMPHLREMLMRHRGACIALVGLSGERVDSKGLVALRRFAGEVVALVAAADPGWTNRLMVPVAAVGPEGIAEAIGEATGREPLDLGTIEVLLHEATNYVLRNDDEGAFLSAARALALAPDQPGVVADVARLLRRMGRCAEGEQLCRTFLLQRPDSEAVGQALDELQAVGQAPQSATS